MRPFEFLVRTAQRTFQPHQILWRYIALFDLALLIVFALLTLLRQWLIRPDCPVTIVQTAAAKVAMVRQACLSHGASVDFAVSIVDNLAAGLVVAAVSSILLWLISPKHQVEEDIAALAPWNIRASLHSSLEDTKRYWFRGRSGRFIRKTVMPELGEAGRLDGQQRVLHMLLPDPTDTQMLADYAHYRSSLDGKLGSWTEARIRNEILATIIDAARRSNGNHFLQIEVFLKSDFSLFRLDMSDDQLVLTREDPKWPAIICSGRSKFYASYIEEFRNETIKAKRVNLSAAIVPAVLGTQDVNTIVGALGFPLALTDPEADAIIDAITNPTLPYG
jgi:hypothetical protein